MSNTNGISKGTLLLLGGAAALLLSPSTRRRVVDVAGDALDGAHNLIEETIVPTAYDVAARASDLTEEARKRALAAQDDLHDYLAEAQKEVERRRRALLDEADDARRDLSKKATVAQKQAARGLMSARSEAEDRAEELRRQAERKLSTTQKEARKSLLGLGALLGDTAQEASHKAEKAARVARKGLLSFQDDVQGSAKKLDKRTRKEITGYQKEIARLENQLASQAASLQVANRRRDDGMGLGALLPLVMLAGAGVVVMVPSVRKTVADALEGFSPEAAQYLNKAGEVAGTFWVDDMPAPKPAPAPAAKPATPAAQASTNPATTPNAAPVADAKAADSKADSGTASASKPADDKKADDKKADDKK